MWLKLKYPASVVGAVGSSAPVYAEADFSEYMGVVGAALRAPAIGGSAACYGAVRDGADAVAAAVRELLPNAKEPSEAWRDAHAALPAALRPCSRPLSELDLAAYEGEIMGDWQTVVQYNEEGTPPYVRDVCRAITNATLPKAPLQRLAAATALFNATRKCIPSSWEKDMAAPLRHARFSPPGCNLTCASDRQWTWQTCNEFGFFQTAGAKDQPFSAFGALTEATVGAAVCEAAFALPKGTRPDTAWANTNYGGRDLRAQNVTVPNGSLDPWHALALVNSSDAFYDACAKRRGEAPPGCAQQGVDDAALVFLLDTAHCRDMWSPNAFASLGIRDPPSVAWAHERIAADVAKYIGAASAAAAA